MSSKDSCQDVSRLVHPYLDGELDDDDRAVFDDHVAECAACQQMLAFETRFKSTLKARLRRPVAPEGLEDRVRAALDAADARGTGPTRSAWRRGAPFAAVFTVAAAVTVFVRGAAVEPTPAPRPEVARVGSKVTVEVRDANDRPLRQPRLHRVKGREVYVDAHDGRVFYVKDGVGYLLTSDLRSDEMLRVVSAGLE